MMLRFTILPECDEMESNLLRAYEQTSDRDKQDGLGTQLRLEI
jgi:hypothetical protein